SPRTSLICSPLRPPAALISAAACSAPFWICAPKAAFGPVSGAPTPIRISADALPPKATTAVSATAERRDFFIMLLPVFFSGLGYESLHDTHHYRAGNCSTLSVLLCFNLAQSEARFLRLSIFLLP